MAIERQIKQRYATRNEEIVAKLREAAGASPPIDPRMKIKRLTAEVAALMALLHGGEWQIEIDHSLPLVMVVPRGGAIEP